MRFLFWNLSVLKFFYAFENLLRKVMGRYFKTRLRRAIACENKELSYCLITLDSLSVP